MEDEEEEGDPMAMEEFAMEEEHAPAPVEKLPVYEFSMVQAKQHDDRLLASAVEKEKALATVEKASVFTFR